MGIETAENVAVHRERTSHDPKSTGSETSNYLENVANNSSECSASDDGFHKNDTSHNPKNWPQWKKDV
jgi:hypothetical protein